MQGRGFTASAAGAGANGGELPASSQTMARPLSSKQGYR
jgi:hypothetical protein